MARTVTLNPCAASRSWQDSLDEQGADGALALGRRERGAIARGVDAEAGGHDAAEEVGVGPLPEIGIDQVIAVLGAGIRHDADALEHPAVVEQGGDDHGKPRFGRAGPARHFARPVPGARDIFVLVVVFEIDFPQSVGVGRAASEIAPAAQLLARRPAVGAAGEAAKLVRRRLRGYRSADLEVPDRRTAQLLGAHQGRPADHTQRKRHHKPHGLMVHTGAEGANLPRRGSDPLEHDPENVQTFSIRSCD